MTDNFTSIWCKVKSDYTNTDLKNLDSILNNHYDKRVQAINNLLNIRPSPSKSDNLLVNLDFINHFYKLLKIDDKCLCNDFINGKVNNGIFQTNTIKFGGGKAGIVYRIDYPNGVLVLKSIDNVNVNKKGYLSLHYIQISDNQGLLSYQSYNSKSPDNKILLYANCDGFATQTCIHMILNEIFKNAKLNNELIDNYVYQYDAFICGKLGYNIMEFAKFGDLSNYLTNYVKTDTISLELAEDIIKQILKPLYILKNDKFGFVHADLKCRNIFVSENDNNEPVFKIADYDKSSITWNSIRFFNNTGNYKIPLSDIKPDMYNDESNKETYYYYTLKNNVLIVQKNTMFNPIGFYTSYDIYTFFYSLMMEPKFFNLFNSYYQIEISNKSNNLPLIYKIWKNLWISDDYHKIMKNIRLKHNILSSVNNNSDKYKQLLTKMRSLSGNIQDFIDNGYKLKIYVDFVYQILQNQHNKIIIDGLPDNIPIDKIKISTGGHICLNECKKRKENSSYYNTCNTNTYSKNKGFYTDYYDWDYC